MKLENKIINIDTVAQVAKALREIKETMVFVGGAVISLYTDDPAANEIRPTKDIDLTVHIVNLSHWEKVQEELAQIGFHPDPFGNSICSYLYKDIAIDIMTMDDGPLGPTNRWFRVGFQNLWSMQANDQSVHVLSAPCFLATKFEAFNSRGKDYRSSHDIEDIIYILDNRLNIVQEIDTVDSTIKKFLQEQLRVMSNKGILTEVLLANIHPLVLEERLPIVETKISQILKL